MSAFFAGHRLARPAAAIHQSLRGDPDRAADALIVLLNEATEVGHAIHRVARPEAPPPTPLLAVDQAEELFSSADAEESRRFLDILARVLDGGRPVRRLDAPRLTTPPLFLWTIRADSLDALLQAAGRAGSRPPQPFLLPPPGTPAAPRPPTCAA